MAYILSGFSDEYSANFDEQLEGAKKLGMEFIELRFVDGVNVSALTEQALKQVKEKLDKNGVKVSAFGSPIGKISLADDFNVHLELAEKVFLTARELDCKLIRIFSFYLNGRERKDCFNEVCERLSKLLEVADRYGVILCLENEEALYGQSPEHIRELCSAFGGRIRTVMDMGNYLLCGHEPYPNAYNLVKEYIEYFHVKDAIKSGEIVPCGEGEACIKEILNDYKKENPEKTVFVSNEPHLVDFVGLNNLANHTLKKKVSFADDKQAFTYAFNNLKSLIKG